MPHGAALQPQRGKSRQIFTLVPLGCFHWLRHSLAAAGRHRLLLKTGVLTFDKGRTARTLGYIVL